MTWGGYYKLNAYFYAPKDDPKHRANWDELYTDEELESKIRPLAEAGKLPSADLCMPCIHFRVEITSALIQMHTIMKILQN